MAQAKKKSPKRPVQLRGGVYILNLGPDTQKGADIRALCAQLDIPVRDINPNWLNDPVGAIVGLLKLRPGLRPYTGQPIEDEFMLIFNLTDTQVNALLAGMRKRNVSVDYKAGVTPTNKMWTLAALIKQIRIEHIQMHRAQ